MKRTKWTKAEVVDFHAIRKAKLKAERRAKIMDVTRLVDTRSDHSKKSVLALVLVAEKGFDSLNRNQQLLIEWLYEQPNDAPLSYYDVKRFAEVLLRLVVMERTEALELIRFEADEIDDGGSELLQKAG